MSISKKSTLIEKLAMQSWSRVSGTAKKQQVQKAATRKWYVTRMPLYSMSIHTLIRKHFQNNWGFVLRLQMWQEQMNKESFVSSTPCISMFIYKLQTRDLFEDFPFHHGEQNGGWMASKPHIWAQAAKPSLKRSLMQKRNSLEKWLGISKPENTDWCRYIIYQKHETGRIQDFCPRVAHIW